MKHTFSIIIITATTLISCSTQPSAEQKLVENNLAVVIDSSLEGNVIKEQSESDTLKGSLQAYASGKIGETNVLIEYYSPAARGRIIWGGLVPFNQVWVTGAHMATSITFDAPLIFNNIEVPAGKYAFFTIPSENTWTIILNNNWKQHLTDKYSPNEDVVRFSIDAQTIDAHQERMRFLIESNTIIFNWDKLKLDIPVSDKK